MPPSAASELPGFAGYFLIDAEGMFTSVGLFENSELTGGRPRRLEAVGAGSRYVVSVDERGGVAMIPAEPERN